MQTWKERWHEIIFEADTPAGKLFDVVLLWAILLSIIAVSLESVSEIKADYGGILYAFEWFVTILFTIEYVLRLLTIKKPVSYAKSFFGIIDLISILPTYLSLIITGAQFLMVFRVLRLLRIFRVLKLVRYTSAGANLIIALKASREKIIVFLGAVLTLVIILGTMMYMIEGEQSGFRNIPLSIYWAIVTLTTVGYGDITPITVWGQFLASAIMIIGYGVIAVPTGIVSAEMTQMKIRRTNTQACPSCGKDGHADDAKFCRFCGHSLERNDL